MTLPDETFASPRFESLLSQLNELTDELESSSGDWPQSQFQLLADAGVLSWVIPTEFGGSQISSAELTDGYARIGSACLTTAFVLTQRNGACQRIAGSENESLKAELLPALCKGQRFATVGISHLTTSRQHLKQPVMQVERRGDDWVFNGTAPWVTGASRADYIVTGGTCEDGTQILAVVPTDRPGVTMLDPPRLLALNESQTGSIKMNDVAIDDHWLLAGPIENVMKRGGGGAGGLTTSGLALGAAWGTIKRLRVECEKRPDLAESIRPLEEERERIHTDLLAAAVGWAVPTNGSSQTSESQADNPVGTAHPTGLTAASIRGRANSLAIRAAHAYMTAAKGAGFVAGHPAGRAVREATFFLVWSCPQSVADAAMREFACVLE